MSYNTYSFQDVTVTFTSGSCGNAGSTGEGVGSISVDMTTEKTVHEVAADGAVMVTKVLGDNGTIVIAIQQTSQLHKYLMLWYNFINSQANPLAAWAAMSIMITSNNLGETTTCTGVSPQKLPNRPYQAQGQLISWTLMAASITQK